MFKNIFNHKVVNKVLSLSVVEKSGAASVPCVA